MLQDERYQYFLVYDENICVGIVKIFIENEKKGKFKYYVWNAERFGISQLHQLRGRVGRSDLQSYCILSSNTRSQDTRARLEIMTQTNDGFVIAEKDLQIRGPGEFLGTRQSGLPDMIIADIVADSKILELARSEAIKFAKTYDIKDYPLLESSKGLNFDGDIFNS